MKIFMLMKVFSENTFIYFFVGDKEIISHNLFIFFAHLLIVVRQWAKKGYASLSSRRGGRFFFLGVVRSEQATHSFHYRKMTPRKIYTFRKGGGMLQSGDREQKQNTALS